MSVLILNFVLLYTRALLGRGIKLQGLWRHIPLMSIILNTWKINIANKRIVFVARVTGISVQLGIIGSDVIRTVLKSYFCPFLSLHTHGDTHSHSNTNIQTCTHTYMDNQTNSNSLKLHANSYMTSH